ncbi:MAG: hypothetical protein LUI09_07535 [Prevotellaceae bacterium]|nr:hypothetical protein [Prevotellaceae bacterium]
MRRWLLVLALTALALGARAIVPPQARVYIFGFAASFKDSVAYITEIQTIDSAYVLKHGFLADRSLYSTQLEHFLEVDMELSDMTCVVFFSKSKSKIEKQFLRVRKKYTADHAVVLSPLPRETFAFEREEWIEPEVTEMPAEESESQEPEGQRPPAGGEGRGTPPPMGGMSPGR